ncbi:MAG: D-2-hydroxyacid dehydrogenase [Oscillospiraceae bacterium]|jgi:D-3-phosphoglycerate dehydrogenase|nr:D-2-hydroxyacid dehydrogenase [Oscillospiraceae bacterium]
MRILASDGMEKASVEKLKSLGHEVVEQFYEPDELKEQVKNFDVLVVRSATKVRAPIIDAAAEAGRLKLILRGGVGVDNIDVAYAQEKGIKVNNTPKASSAAVAELAIGHMFCLARYIHIANVTMRDGKWNKKNYEGIELMGKTLGLIGVGRIGRSVADRAAALGMHVIYTEHPSFVPPADDPYKLVTKDELLAQADFISIHMPKQDKPVIGQEELAKLKEGVFLVNTSRGGLIDEAELIKALDSGKVAGAALDVFEEEPTKNEKLYTHPKVSATPHIGASTKEAQGRIGEELVAQILELTF